MKILFDNLRCYIKGRCAYARVLIENSANKPWEEYIEVQTWDLNTKTSIIHSLQLE